MLMESNHMNNNGITDATGIALVCGVKVKTIRKWTGQQKIPFVRLSPRCVRYDIAAVREWMATRSVKPLTP